jgi:hypothetical protein
MTAPRAPKARRDGIASGGGHWVERGERLHQRLDGWACTACALATVGTTVPAPRRRP